MGLALPEACIDLSARAVQGDVLYVPTYWLHYLVTLSDLSYQCNTRSGGSTVGLGEVRTRVFQS